MLYNFLVPFADDVQFFNLFRYLTFRSGGAMLTAMIFSFVIGPAMIRWLRQKQSGGQPIRSDGPESHLLTKQGTPTMGGIMMLFSLGVSTVLWADLNNGYIWIVLLVTFGYGVIGFLDDYLKISKKNHKGLSGKLKLIGQFSIALAAAIWVQQLADPSMVSHLAIPYTKTFLWDLGWLYLPFVMLVMVGRLWLLMWYIVI